jgi:hypothetical protein
MRTVRISPSGVAKAAARLDAVGDASTDQSQTMDDLAADAPQAITKLPHRTGRLEASVRDPHHPEHYQKVYPDGYEVGTTVWYGRFVFGGTEHQAAQKPRVARKRLTEQAARVLARSIGNAGR